MTELNTLITAIQNFENHNLRKRIAELERDADHQTSAQIAQMLKENDINEVLLDNAFQLKKVAGQINVIVHTVGILLTIPYILEEDEIIDYLSLGAGNTGRNFDLETDKRVAEFKFIQWRGGSDTIRENSLFKDLYNLVEYDTQKAKYMYVIGKDIPLNFLYGRRAISSVLSRNTRLWEDFQESYGERYKTVREYYTDKKDAVFLEDLREVAPIFKDY